MEKDMVIVSHAKCTDGFCSSFIFWLRYGERAEYIFLSHDQLPYKGLDPRVLDNKNVIIVDFSFSKEELKSLALTTKTLQVLDHHLTAQNDLSDLPFCKFDQSKSGAGLAWEYCFPTNEVPFLVKAVQDRDLWTWKIKDSKFFLLALDSIDKTFEAWNEFYIANKNQEDIDKQIILGKSLQKFKDTQINMAMETKQMFMFQGFRIPVVNSLHFKSEIGMWLSKGNSFAIVYSHDGEKYCCSLRSNDLGEDVSVVAKKLGGGGHRNASAFTTKNLFDLLERCE